MEVILAVGFGHHVRVQHGEADQLTSAAGSVFAASREGSSLSGVVTLLSKLALLLSCLECTLKYICIRNIIHSIFENFHT